MYFGGPKMEIVKEGAIRGTIQPNGPEPGMAQSKVVRL